MKLSKFTILFCLVFLLMQLFEPVCAGQHDTFRKYLNLAENAHKTQNLKTAISYYTKAFLLNPDNEQVISGLVSSWRLAVKLNPNAANNHIGLGQALMIKGEHNEAMCEFRKAFFCSDGSESKEANRLFYKYNSRSLFFQKVKFPNIDCVLEKTELSESEREVLNLIRQETKEEPEPVKLISNTSIDTLSFSPDIVFPNMTKEMLGNLSNRLMGIVRKLESIDRRERVTLRNMPSTEEIKRLACTVKNLDPDALSTISTKGFRVRLDLKVGPQYLRKALADTDYTCIAYKTHYSIDKPRYEKLFLNVEAIVLKRMSAPQLVRLFGTSGIGGRSNMSCARLAALIREWDEKYGVEFDHLQSNYVSIRFNTVPDDPYGFVSKIAKLSSNYWRNDGKLDAAQIEHDAELLKKSRCLMFSL